jgi:hypothetical protein
MQPRPTEAEYDPQEPPRRENYTAEEWRELKREERARKREFDVAMKIQVAKVRAAKRVTRGIKALNPFLALAIKRPKTSRKVRL